MLIDKLIRPRRASTLLIRYESKSLFDGSASPVGAYQDKKLYRAINFLEATHVSGFTEHDVFKLGLEHR